MNATFDGYIRVSRTNGRSGESYRSPSDQRASIERLAEQFGITLGEVVTEEDVSGKKASRERELDRLVRKVRDGRSGGLIVYNVKRYSRNYADGFRTALDIFEAGGRIISEDFQLTGVGAKSVLSFLLEFAEEELRQKTETWRRAVDGATARGVFVGRTPIGFDRLPDSTLGRNKDADAVRAVFRGRARGKSWNDLATMLEEAQVKTATGQERWSISSVRSLIRHPIYKGTLTNGISHHFPEYAVVTRSEWEAAQEPRGRRPKRRPAGSWSILSGLVFCDGCGHALTAYRNTRAGRTYQGYRCENRKCSSRARANGAALDALVADWTITRVAYAASIVGVGEEPDVAKVTALEQALDEAESELAGFLAVARASDPGFEQAVESRRAAVEQAKTHLTEERNKARVFPTEEQSRAIWKNGTLEDKRDLVRKMVDRVTVKRVGEKLKFPAPGVYLKDEHLQRIAEDMDLPGVYPFSEAETMPSTALEDRIKIKWKGA